jgi:predicted DCC family thiol-disulfide oxidoreductase YuxK
MTDELAARCARAMHVLAPDGTLYAGGRASLFVLGRLGWPRLARVLGTPPLVWLVELGYRLVAANRGWLSTLLPRTRPAGPRTSPRDRR